MPVHDWSKVTAGTFHDFHLGWMVGIRSKLNCELLPEGYFAMLEPSRPKLDLKTEEDVYASNATRVAIFNSGFDRKVCAIEVISREDKSTKIGLAQFIARLMEEWVGGSNVLVVDLHQPTDAAPFGVSTSLCERWNGRTPVPFEVEKPFEIVKLRVGLSNGNVKPTMLSTQKIGLHSQLPSLAVYLSPALEPASGSEIDEINSSRYGTNVSLPLEETYMDAWNDLPRRWREVIDSTN